MMRSFSIIVVSAAVMKLACCLLTSIDDPATMKPRDSASWFSTDSVVPCRHCWLVPAPYCIRAFGSTAAAVPTAAHGCAGSKSTAISWMPRFIVPRSIRTM